MKKTLISFTIGAAAIIMISLTDAKAENPCLTSDHNQALVQDTNQRPKRDSTKWNKKKYRDSTQMPRRDSVRVK